MKSLRAVANCLWLTRTGVAPDPTSLLLHVHGYTRHTLFSSEVSLLEQLDRIDGQVVHLNVIRVGGDAFSDSDESDINVGLKIMRDTYAKAGLGVARVEHFDIPVSEANGREDIDSDDEAETLSNEWTVHNDGLDLFVIRSGWTEDGAARSGISATDGPCDKDDDTGMSGSVASAGGLLTGNTFAHEIGHYLGLEHVPDESCEDAAASSPELAGRLMFPCGVALVGEITSEEAETMKEHCFVTSGC